MLPIKIQSRESTVILTAAKVDIPKNVDHSPLYTEISPLPILDAKHVTINHYQKISASSSNVTGMSTKPLGDKGEKTDQPQDDGSDI